MMRVVAWLGLALLGCATDAGVDDAGGGGSTSSGGDGGVGNSSWGGAPGGSGANGGSAGAAGSANTKPHYLPPGRTYDQQTDYIEWQGPVSFVMLEHKDQTSLPAAEGGASCSGGCTEQVTRIESGGALWGRFRNITGINVQLAATSEAGVGQGVLEICGANLPAIDLTSGSTGLPGFNNLPSPAHAVSAADDCTWRVKAQGGFVYFRAVTVTGEAVAAGGTGGGGPG